MKIKRLSLLLLFVAIASSWCKAQVASLWGMTSAGGPYDAGTLFAYYPLQVLPDDSLWFGGENIEHVFGYGSDGSSPCGSVIQAGNCLLYGMTQYGGANGGGIIFSYDTSTGAYTDVHDFGAGADGVTPTGSLLQANNGLLYGTASIGGANGEGVIFSYETSTGKYSRLYDFRTDSDAQFPGCTLMQAKDSLLYGVTATGGIYGQGAIFTYNIADSSERLIYSFGDTVVSPEGGLNPCGTLIQANDSILYGMTTQGGPYPGFYYYSNGGGTIFSYNIFTGALNTLHDFGNPDTNSLTPFGDGYTPNGSLVLAPNGLLYGMTYGIKTSQYYGGEGVIFSYNIQTQTYAVVHYFGGVFPGFLSDEFDGNYPNGSLIMAGGDYLYGMTSSGGGGSTGFGVGVIDSGVIFCYNIVTGAYSIVSSFDGGSTDGARPLGDLLALGLQGVYTGIWQASTANSTGNLSVFPNPSSGQFTVKLPEPTTGQDNSESDYTIEIYNVVGEKIYQSVLSNALNTINLGNQPSGMYFINLRTAQAGESIATGKVIITK